MHLPKIKNRFLRWLTYAAIMVVLLFGILWLVLWWREPADYSGELAALLPAHTSGFVKVGGLTNTIRDFSETALFKQFIDEDDLLELLLSERVYERYAEIKDTPEFMLKLTLTLKFLHRYFGQNAAAALVRYEPDQPPALFVIAQTQLGFHERVAEFCTEIFPKLTLSNEVYHDSTLYTYRGDEPKDSFSYFRYGKTVILSLRSDDPRPLKRLIDFRRAGGANALAADPRFQESIARTGHTRGLTGYINSAGLPGTGGFAADLRDIMGDERFTKNLAKAKYKLLLNAVQNHETTNLSLTYDGRLAARAELHNPRMPALGGPLKAFDDAVFAAAAPRDATLALSAWNVNLAEVMLDLPRWVALFKDDPEKEEEPLDIAMRMMLQQLGGWDLVKKLEGILGQETLLVLDSVEPGAIFPAARLSVVSRREDAARAAADVRAFVEKLGGEPREAGAGAQQWAFTKYGGYSLLMPFYVTLVERQLFLTTDPQAHNFLSAGPAEGSLLGNPIYQRAQAGDTDSEGNVFTLFANLERLQGQLRALREQRIFGKKVFADGIDKNEKLIRILPNLQGLSIEAQALPSALRVNFILPVK